VDRNPGSSPGARWWLETKSSHSSTVVARQCSASHVTTCPASSLTVLHESVMSFMNESYLTCMRHVSYKCCIARHTRFESHIMQSSRESYDAIKLIFNHTLHCDHTLIAPHPPTPLLERSRILSFLRTRTSAHAQDWKMWM